MTNTRQLLADYAENASDSAFRELVDRYVDLVYSTALRLVNGDAHRAEDVVQTVFTDLARLAKTLARDSRLGGWLHRHTCFVATKLIRGEQRRERRERQAAEMNTLHQDNDLGLDALVADLDHAVDQLAGEDRTAIILRFYERLDLRSVGAALGSSENAAQKRIARALERLHQILTRRGVTLTSTSVAAFLAAKVVTAAPVGMAPGVASTALATAASSTGTALTTLGIMGMTKLKMALLAGVVITSLSIPIALQYRTQSQLRAENEALRQRVQELVQSPVQTPRPANPSNSPVVDLPNDQLAELLRLRGEVSTLRRRTNELMRLGEINRQGQSGSNHQEPTTAANLLPKESWAYAGYTTPAAAFESVAWALSKGDLKALLASLTPDARRELEQQIQGKSEDQVARMLQGEVKSLNALRLDRVKDVSDTETTFVLYTEETDNGLVKTKGESVLKFLKIGTEWRCAGL